MSALDTQYKYHPVPEVIYHKRVVVEVEDVPNPYPYNTRFPPDPGIYAPSIAIIIQEGNDHGE